MSHFRKIDVRIWNDAKFRSLDDHGKLLFFRLLTDPNMTALGAIRANIDGIIAEMKGNRDAYLDAFRDVIRKGMADYDEHAPLIALPNFVKYNPPTAPNTVKAWANQLEYLPECELKTLVIQRAVAFTDAMSHAFRDAIPHAMRYPLSTEHGDYPSQGEDLTGYSTAPSARPMLIAGQEVRQ